MTLEETLAAMLREELSARLDRAGVTSRGTPVAGVGELAGIVPPFFKLRLATMRRARAAKVKVKVGGTTAALARLRGARRLAFGARARVIDQRIAALARKLEAEQEEQEAPPVTKRDVMVAAEPMVRKVAAEAAQAVRSQTRKLGERVAAARAAGAPTVAAALRAGATRARALGPLARQGQDIAAALRARANLVQSGGTPADAPWGSGGFVTYPELDWRLGVPRLPGPQRAQTSARGLVTNRFAGMGQDVAEGASSFVPLAGDDVDEGAEAFGATAGFDVGEGAEAFGAYDEAEGAEGFPLTGFGQAGAEARPAVDW